MKNMVHTFSASNKRQKDPHFNENVMKNTILVIAAHPDDEILGCGGVMAKHIADGDHVHVVILAEGITSRAVSRQRGSDEKKLSELAKTAQRANNALGVNSLTLHDFPDNRMDSIDLLDVVKVIESHISTVSPDTVYTHFAGDVNIDHQIVNQAVTTACRPQPHFPVKKILHFEIPSSTEWQLQPHGPSFSPNYFVPLQHGTNLNVDFLLQKLKALEIYDSEMRDWPHPRSVEAVEHLAKWRGASIGVTAAEAFMLGRCIVP